MKKVFFLSFSLAFTCVTSAQVTDIKQELSVPEPVQQSQDDVVFTIVEQMPEYEGGMDSLMRFIGRNINYPSIGIDENLQGTVYVNFIVNKDGRLSDCKVLRNSPGHKDFEVESLRVVKLTNGQWKPGFQGGKPVRVTYNLPIRFKLN